MGSLVERIASVATKPLTRDLTVVAAEDVGGGFRLVVLGGVGKVGWAVGQKVQLRAGGFDFRTYTPLAWTGDEVSLLVALDATGPGTALVRSLAPGAVVSAMGPSRAVDLAKVTTAPLFVGDETSIALGAAWEAAGPVPAAGHLYEVGDPAAVAPVCERFGVPGPSLVARRDDDAHLADLAAEVADQVRAAPDAVVVLTGKAQTIRAVRGALKDAGLAPAVKVKAHWDPRRSGLD